MDRKELKLELERLADRFSEGWHKGIKIDASDIMLLTEAAQALDQPAQPAQPEQEPVADDFFRMIADRNPKPFSTPQRTWVDLADDEEIADYLGDEYHTMTDSDLRFFRLGIAAAKEKNT